MDAAGETHRTPNTCARTKPMYSALKITSNDPASIAASKPAEIGFGHSHGQAVLTGTGNGPRPLQAQSQTRMGPGPGGRPKVIQNFQQYAQKLAKAGTTLTLLFFLHALYLWGAFYKSSERTHNFNILFLDHDDSMIGEHLKRAYANLEQETFPKMTFMNEGLTPLRGDLHILTEVGNLNYWAAAYLARNASARLQTALTDPASAMDYAKKPVLIYTWNQAYFPQLGKLVAENLAQLVDAAEGSLTQALLGNLTVEDVHVDVIRHPIPLSAHLVPGGKMSTSSPFNHFGIIFLLLPCTIFMQLIVLNQSPRFGNFRPTRRQEGGFFLTSGTLLPLFLSLTLTITIQALEEGLGLGDFFLCWLLFWFTCTCFFCVILAAQRLMTQLVFRVLSGAWLMFNLVSSSYPLEGSPVVYQWGWALPGHAVNRLYARIVCHSVTHKAWSEFLVLVLWTLASISVILLSSYISNTGRK